VSKFKLTITTLFVTAVVVSMTSSAAQAQPSPTTLAQAKAANYCSDPWVTAAIWFVTAGTRNPSGFGTMGECNPQLYNGGSWGSYALLQQYVGASLNSLSGGGARISLTDIGGNQLQIRTDLGGGYAEIITVSGHIVNTNGSNIVAQGAGNFIGHNGSAIVAQGAGNYRVQSVDQKALTLPNNHVLVVTRPTTTQPPPPPPPPPVNNGLCGDPSVTAAIRLITGRVPNGTANTGECLTTRYGGGRWTNYTDLVMKVGVAFAWPHGTCADSWIVMATLDVKGTLPTGTGTAQQCAAALYSGGHWASYNGPQMPSLINGVKAYWGVR
jgi:hypothetical protein